MLGGVAGRMKRFDAHFADVQRIGIPEFVVREGILEVLALVVRAEPKLGAG